MSTMAYTSNGLNETPPKIMPAEVGTVAAAWWLTLGLSMLLLAGLLPMCPKPIAADGSITQTGWLLFLGVALLLLVFGAYVGSALRHGKPGALKLCRLGVILLLILDLLVMALVMVLAAGNKAEAEAGGVTLLIGPSPLPAMILLGMLVLMPVLFALMVFSASSAPVVQEYFAPPERDMPVSYGSAEAAGGRWEGAGAAAAGLAAGAAGTVALADDVESETVSLSDPYVGVDPPSRVSPEAFDAALAHEMASMGGAVDVAEHAFPSGAEELPSAAAESSVSEVFADPMADADSPDGSVAEVIAESDDEPADDVEAMPDAEALEDEGDSGIAIFEGSVPPAEGDSFIVKGPPRLTESQVEIKDMDDPPDLTGLGPVETWDFTKQHPDEGDKKKP